MHDPGQDWWAGGDALCRFIADLLAAEARRLFPSAAPLPPPEHWRPETRLDETGLGFDSLDRLRLAGALSEALHLHESGIEDGLLARMRFGEWCAIAAQGLQRRSASLTFRTSGSTGAPTACAHRLVDLAQEVDALAALVPAGTRRILAAVPANHLYGFLFTILLPQRLGGLPVVPLRSHSPGAVRAQARRGDLVIGHPAFWAAAVRAAPAGWEPGFAGVTSTAPCPPALARALQQAGLSRLLQIYGASETAGLGWRDDPDTPFTLLPHWQRDMEADGLRRRCEDDATLPFVTVPDRLAWIDERRFRILGRRDEAVQVGGINVFPAHVRTVLLDHPDLADAAVRAMTPGEGERLKAFVVPRDPLADRQALHQSLVGFTSSRLSTAERPRAYTFGSALPVAPDGKATDWPIGPAPTEA